MRTKKNYLKLLFDFRVAKLSYLGPIFPYFLPIFIWLIVVSWRPWFLGFYHDDWAVLQPLLPGDASRLLEQHLSRPLYVFIILVTKSLLPMNAFYYQALLVFLMACSAVAVGAFAKAIVAHITTQSSTLVWASCIAASVWLTIPWNLGSTVWPTPFPGLISVSGFCIMGCILLGNDSIKVKLIKAIPVFIFISLISELFWFSFFPVALMFLYSRGKDLTREKIWQFFITLFFFGVAQICLGLINRLIVYFGIGSNRVFNPSFIGSTWGSISILPSELSRAVAYPSIFWVAIIFLGAILLMSAITHPRKKTIYSILFAIVFGSILTLLLFALAGYRVETTGIFSRTTIVLSLWLCILPALVISAVDGLQIWIKRVVNALLIILLGVLAISCIKNSRAWAVTWEFEKKLLNSIPYSQIAAGAKQDSFLIVDAGLSSDNAVEGVGAYWDITGALFVLYPDLRSKFAAARNRPFATMLNGQKWRTIWDGKQVSQYWCGNAKPEMVLWELDAPSEVFLWEHSSQKLTHYVKPFQMGCNK
jgi:hypothetical protein